MILRAVFISTLVFAEAATAYAATAHATINSIDVNGVGPVIGTVTFKDTKYGLLVTPDISGLPIGVHGFHVHDKGACGRAEHEGKITAGFVAGGHYDPEHTGKHLGPYETGGHRGDLPVLVVGADGEASLPVLAPRGRSLIIHEGGDNYSEQPDALAVLVNWVELKTDGMDVSIKLPIPGAAKSQSQGSEIAITRSFPMQLKRRGVELRLIVGDHDRSAGAVNLPLLKAVARAHRWFDELSTEKAKSLAQISTREGLGVRYVGRLIRLAFLAPDIVESIMRGRQPMNLTAEALTRRVEIPFEWRSQKEALNIP
jgi:superoxide dismutase, Cu-Zn family